MDRELANTELDERLQKQVRLADEALGKGGIDYAIQISGEILKRHPGAYEVRALLWKALRADGRHATGLPSLRARSSRFQFKVSNRSMLKKDPLVLIQKCDNLLRQKRTFPELFASLDQAAEALGWAETRVVACQALAEMETDRVAPRLALAEVLLEVNRPREAIDYLEQVLSKEPSNADGQTLLKNASVAETLQRGNWEDTGTSFNTKNTPG